VRLLAVASFIRRKLQADCTADDADEKTKRKWCWRHIFGILAPRER